ncbi:NucA/NucB deoxyribonuclease domain-containing protein [Actinoplanes aureus]|uniref:Deoxyribonuclease NucA/NucB domain-containing protein n=1 Tax=Actinoplanes aureus TaxID=2792083 RepID=A0A931CQ34_9ACTN|nr:hypothetical protein [Actinoplanes aureus]MBG0569020.1 hypothetical protein [Actinoplanes aureus]
MGDAYIIGKIDFDAAWISLTPLHRAGTNGERDTWSFSVNTNRFPRNEVFQPDHHYMWVYDATTGRSLGGCQSYGFNDQWTRSYHYQENGAEALSEDWRAGAMPAWHHCSVQAPYDFDPTHRVEARLGRKYPSMVLARSGEILPTDEQPTYKVLSYVIADPDLVKQPETVAQELKQYGNLDRLGVKPAAGNKPSEIVRPETLALMSATQQEPDSYVIDSGRYPGSGQQPEDRYNYIELGECRSTDAAIRNVGWIKNRYSYCQRHLIAGSVIECRFRGCSFSSFLANSTVIGYGKRGSYRDTAGDRWAQFTVSIQMLEASGVYNNVGTRLTTRMGCEGDYKGSGPDSEACHGGGASEVTKSLTAWTVDHTATLDLVSEAQAPDASRGEQLATGVFRVDYDFDFPQPWIIDFGAASSPEGGMRFDSAWYLAPTSPNDQLGSVFDRAMPGLGYSIADDVVRGVAVHLLEAETEPEKTSPTKPGKSLPGFSPSNPLRRLAQAKGQYQNERYRANDSERVSYCRSVEFTSRRPEPTTENPNYDCDEYPFRSTYEGAGRYRFEGTDGEYKNSYSVKWVNRTQNQSAGGRLGRWYLEERILDEDKFFMQITP